MTDKYCTENVYREMQGCYREIGLQGFLFYRDILGMRLAVIVIVAKAVMIKGILLSLQNVNILCNFWGITLKALQSPVNIVSIFYPKVKCIRHLINALQ